MKTQYFSGRHKLMGASKNSEAQGASEFKTGVYPCK